MIEYLASGILCIERMVRARAPAFGGVGMDRVRSRTGPLERFTKANDYLPLCARSTIVQIALKSTSITGHDPILGLHRCLWRQGIKSSWSHLSNSRTKHETCRIVWGRMAAGLSQYI